MATKYPKSTINRTVPQIGQTVTIYGQPARIIAVYRLGTIDVQLAGGQCYRLTGLTFTNTASHK